MTTFLLKHKEPCYDRNKIRNSRSFLLIPFLKENKLRNPRIA